MKLKLVYVPKTGRSFSLLLGVLTPSFTQAATTGDGGDWQKPESWFIYVIVSIVLLGFLACVLRINAVLSTSSWSLADALSEETEVTAMEGKDGSIKPSVDAASKPIMITQMRASASRVIALIGMMAILFMFLGFGALCLYSFGEIGKMPDSIDNVVKFLAGGLTLFAPYAVNKFSKLFEGLSPKKA